MVEKVLLWDLGNVVVRWSPEKILKCLDYSQEDTAYLRKSLFAHADWLDLDRGVTTEEVVATRLVAESGLSMDQALRCFDTVRESLTDIKGSVELLNEVAATTDIPMYVLSNMSNPNAEYLRQRSYFSHFQGIVISAEENLNKPDLALFERVLQRYQLVANSILFVDDTLANIEAARSLGMAGLHFDIDRSEEGYQVIRQFVGI